MTRLLLRLTIIAFILSQNLLYTQNVTFKGKDYKTNASVKIDSIYIYDLTLNKDTVLKGTTAIDLSSIVVGVNEGPLPAKLSLTVKNNILQDPNDIITFNISTNKDSRLNISIISDLGEQVSSLQTFVSTGSHHYSFTPGRLATGMYFVAVSNGGRSEVEKFINLCNGSSNPGEIKYMGAQALPIVQPGDTYNFTGYSAGYEPSHIDNQTSTDGEEYEFVFKAKETGPLTRNHLIPLLYKHIKDDDGSTFAANTDCVFSFEPNDSLHLYIGSDNDAASVAGSYKIESGKLHITITDDYFPLDITFPVDTALDKITMPFRVFSTEDGSSTWEKVRLSPEDHMLYLFNAVALDETGQTSTSTGKKVVDWGNSVKDNQEDSEIQVISGGDPTVVIIYKNGTQSKLLLYSKNFLSTNVTLTPGTLSGDPRTHLNVTPPKINEFDPVEKTALFMGPWNSVKYPEWKKGKGGVWEIDYSRMADTFGRFDSLDVMADLMIKEDYTAEVVKDEDAGVIGFIEHLLPGNGRATSPGFIYISSHGDSKGCISTGTVWTTTTEYNQVKSEIDNKYPDLWTYGGGTEAEPKVFSIYNLGMGWRPGKTMKNIFVTPLFWKWLNEKGADFSRSFMHIGACLTDGNPELRETIKARALVLYDIAVPEDFCAATERYFIECLSRPSRSTEEVYYNILRIIVSGQMIYKEDLIFNGTLPKDGEVFVGKGYGYDGGDIVPYQQAGWWNTNSLNKGSVWYLLWASRWGQDVQKGWEALLNCWDSCWQYGDPGGLANPGCNNMAPGAVPNSIEVAYAGWLLKGELTITPQGTITIVPRFTLNDGKE